MEASTLVVGTLELIQTDLVFVTLRQDNNRSCRKVCKLHYRSALEKIFSFNIDLR